MFARVAERLPGIGCEGWPGASSPGLPRSGSSPPLPSGDVDMAGKERVRPILEAMLEAHRSAFELGEHEVSFHALSAAAHAAESLEDVDALERVAQLSRGELAWLDAHAPDHRLSSRSAAERRHQSIFEQLAVTATAMRQRIGIDRRREQAAGPAHGFPCD